MAPSSPIATTLPTSPPRGSGLPPASVARSCSFCSRCSASPSSQTREGPRQATAASQEGRPGTPREGSMGLRMICLCWLWMLTQLAGCCRPDGHVSFGFSLMRGKRATMEDFYTAQVGASEVACRWAAQCSSSLQGSHCWLCCSFKSHQGVAAAQWASLACLTVSRLLRSPC